MILQKRFQLSNGPFGRNVTRNPITGASTITIQAPAPAATTTTPVQTSTQGALAHPTPDEVTGFRGSDQDSLNRAIFQGAPQFRRALNIYRNQTTGAFEVPLLRTYLAQVRAELATHTQVGPVLNDYARILQLLTLLVEYDRSGRAQWWNQYQQTIGELIGNPAAVPPTTGRLTAFQLPPEQRLYLLNSYATNSRQVAKILYSDESTLSARNDLFNNLYGLMIGICEGELHLNTPEGQDNPLYLVYLGLRLEGALSETEAAILQRQRAQEFLEWFSHHDEAWFEQHGPAHSDLVIYAPNGPIGNWTQRIAYFLRHPERLTLERPGQPHPAHLTGEALAAQDLISALHRLSVPTRAESAAIALNNTALLSLLGVVIPFYTYSGQMQRPDEFTRFTRDVRAQIDLFPTKSLREILTDLRTPPPGIRVNVDSQRIAQFILDTPTTALRHLVDNLLRENATDELHPLHGMKERNFMGGQEMLDAINRINALPLLTERYGIQQVDVHNPYHQRCMEDLLIRETALRHYLGQSLDPFIPPDAQPDWVEWWRNRADTLNAAEISNQFVEQLTLNYTRIRDNFSHAPYAIEESNLVYQALSYWVQFMGTADQLGFTLNSTNQTRISHLRAQLDQWNNDGLIRAVGETFSGTNILTMLGTAVLYELLEVAVVARGAGRLVEESGRLNIWGSLVTGGTAGTISAFGSTLAHHRWGGDYPLHFREFGHDMGVNVAGQSIGLSLYAYGQSIRNPLAAILFSQAGRFGSAFAISEVDSLYTNRMWLNEHQRNVFYLSYGANSLVHGSVRYLRYRRAANNTASDPENPGWLARGTFGEPNIRTIQDGSLRANDPALLRALRASFWNPRALEDFLNDQDGPSSPNLTPRLTSDRNPQVSVPNVPIQGIEVNPAGNGIRIRPSNLTNPDARAVAPQDLDIQVWIDGNGQLMARNLSNGGLQLRGTDTPNNQPTFVPLPMGTPKRIQGGRIEVYAPGADPETAVPILQFNITPATPRPTLEPPPFAGPVASPQGAFGGGGAAFPQPGDGHTMAVDPSALPGGGGRPPGVTQVAPPPRPFPAGTFSPAIRFRRHGQTTIVEAPAPGENQTFTIDAANQAGVGLPQGLRVAVSADQFDGLAVRNQSTTGHQVVITTPAGEQMSLPAIPNRGGRTNNAHPVVKIYAPGVNVNSADAVPLFEFDFGAAQQGRTLLGTAPGAAQNPGRAIPDTLHHDGLAPEPTRDRGPAPTRLAAPDPRAVAQPAHVENAHINANAGGLSLNVGRPAEGEHVVVTRSQVPTRLQSQMPEGVEVFMSGTEDGGINVSVRNTSGTSYRFSGMRSENGRETWVDIPGDGSVINLGEGNVIHLYRPGSSVAAVTLYPALLPTRHWWQWRPWQ